MQMQETTAVVARKPNERFLVKSVMPSDVDTFYGLIPKSPSTADFSVVHGLLFGLFGYRVLN